MILLIGVILLLSNLNVSLALLNNNDILIDSPPQRNLILSAPTIVTSAGITSGIQDNSNLYWNDNDVTVPTNWNQLRYSTSTLQSSTASSSPPRSKICTIYPTWMNGYWSTKYQFSRASFPQGRKVLSLRVPGAGIATCLSLPNVGYSPPAFVQKYLVSSDGSVYEDVAYNMPRKLEAFWSQCQVTAVQTGGLSEMLSPKCFITGDQCNKEENPRLHDPTTRFSLDFEGPTRSGGRLLQSIDTTLLRTTTVAENDYCVRISNQYVQFNIQQDLQCFYKEYIVLQNKKKSDDDTTVQGSVRVAAFLPQQMTENTDASYTDAKSLAFYEYTINLKQIDESEAIQM